MVEALADLTARVTHLEVATRVRKDSTQGVDHLRWLYAFSRSAYELVRKRTLVGFYTAAGRPIPKELLPPGPPTI